jgi:hypothetical protein
VLAAAYAHAGRFDQAMLLAAEAVTRAVESGRDQLADAIGDRLVLYGLGIPYRDEPVPPETTRTAGVIER